MAFYASVKRMCREQPVIRMQKTEAVSRVNKYYCDWSGDNVLPCAGIFHKENGSWSMFRWET
jgi:hypothetical protein